MVALIEIDTEAQSVFLQCCHEQQRTESNTSVCTQLAQMSCKQGQRQCSVIGNSPDGDTTIFKNKHVAQRDGLKQKE